MENYLNKGTEVLYIYKYLNILLLVYIEHKIQFYNKIFNVIMY